MFGHVCLFGSGGPLACLVMFKQTCWELWSLLHMAHWHVYILFDRLTCTMTCQVKQMIGIVSWAKVPWQKLQTKVVSTSCFEMSWWGSLEAKYLVFFFSEVAISRVLGGCALWYVPMSNWSLGFQKFLKAQATYEGPNWIVGLYRRNVSRHTMQVSCRYPSNNMQQPSRPWPTFNMDYGPMAFVGKILESLQ